LISIKSLYDVVFLGEVLKYIYKYLIDVTSLDASLTKFYLGTTIILPCY